MHIYDISQELFSGAVFPGDLAPTRIVAASLQQGDACNLSNLSLCAHNATHLDAPLHFLPNGKDVAQIDLDRCVGAATVVEISQTTVAEEWLQTLPPYCRRLLLKGEVAITPEIAQTLVERGIWLIGVESQTVGFGENITAVHLKLLENEVVILEGLRLQSVPAGNYFLSAAPLKMAGCDGSPCRAYLIDHV